MKKIVLVCGLIAGAIVTIMMVISTIVLNKNETSQGSLWLGYTSMILAFSLIFVGIKNYRDKQNNGVIGFGKAFKIGLYITLIASTIYVLAWLVEYYVLIPDFMDKYTNSIIQQMKNSAATAADITKKMQEMESYRQMYKNPLFVILLTYVEILPVGLIVCLIAAFILKKPARTTASLNG